jgi:hypothetical protein
LNYRFPGVIRQIAIASEELSKEKEVNSNIWHSFMYVSAVVFIYLEKV